MSEYFKITKEAQRKYLRRTGSADMNNVQNRLRKREYQMLMLTDRDEANKSVDYVKEVEEEV